MADHLARLLEASPIFVTGLGCFCAAGSGAEESFQRVVKGVPLSAVHDIDGFPIVACAAPRLDQVPPEFRMARRMDPSVRMLLTAGREAWEDAGLSDAGIPSDRIGVFVGSSRGPMELCLASNEPSRVARPLPSLAANTTIGCLSGVMAQFLGARGPSVTVSANCASAAHAMILAAQQILLGTIDVALAGGCEAPLIPSVLAHLRAAGILGSHPDPALVCRPFSASRNGTVFGDAAAFLVLESAQLAHSRGARMLARFRGWAAGSDDVQRAGMSESSGNFQRNLIAAMQLAAISPEQIGYVHTHGTGTRLNDRIEALALMQTFPQGVACSSTKPITGHCMGASAALGAVFAIKAMEHGLLPPSANCDPKDPDFDLDLVGPYARPARPEAVTVSSAGFWGTNAQLIFSQ